MSHFESNLKMAAAVRCAACFHCRDRRNRYEAHACQRCHGLFSGHRLFADLIWQPSPHATRDDAWFELPAQLLPPLSENVPAAVYSLPARTL